MMTLAVWWLRLCGLALATFAVFYMRSPEPDYGGAWVALACGLVAAIGPLRILKFVAGLALMFFAFG